MSTARRSRKFRSGNTSARAIAFKAAIAYARAENARYSALEFCREHGVTPGHLYKVLSGERQSPPLVEKVDAFIAKHVPTAASA
jgi:hypothetical protein